MITVRVAGEPDFAPLRGMDFRVVPQQRPSCLLSAALARADELTDRIGRRGQIDHIDNVIGAADPVPWATSTNPCRRFREAEYRN